MEKWSQSGKWRILYSPLKAFLQAVEDKNKNPKYSQAQSVSVLWAAWAAGAPHLSAVWLEKAIYGETLWAFSLYEALSWFLMTGNIAPKVIEKHG